MTALLAKLFPHLDGAQLELWAASGLRALIWLILGVIVARLGRRSVQGILGSRAAPQRGMVLSRMFYWLVVGLTTTAILKELGLDISVLLGAAGILTVAIGFASQTSASNFISGIFLMAEEPFIVGDTVRIGQTLGTILSIDTLSIKILTFDNIFVRVPNESVIKTEVANLSRFKLRRLDIPLKVPFGAERQRVEALLLEVADAEPRCMDEPRAMVILTGFGQTWIELEFRVWVEGDHFLEMRNAMIAAVTDALVEARIDLPAPRQRYELGEVRRADVPVKQGAEPEDKVKDDDEEDGRP